MRNVHGAKRVSQRAIMQARRAHGLVILYHRVAAAPWDPWDICVSPKRFEEQPRLGGAIPRASAYES
jgi:hypothetical protein